MTAISAISVSDYVTWALEVAPIIVGLPWLYLWDRKAPVSPLLVGVVVVHACILATGGHYTYAHVPMGDWLVQAGWCERNNFDKLGHVFQGITPALITIEIWHRRYREVRIDGFIATLIVLVAGGISALYEIIEWWAAVVLGSGADEFLGTQGYAWDTQSDMLCALLGALVSVLVLRRWMNPAPAPR